MKVMLSSGNASIAACTAYRSVLCLASAAAHAAAGPNMKPGLWEVTVKMEMLGMPPRTSQRCITAAAWASASLAPSSATACQFVACDCARPTPRRSASIACFGGVGFVGCGQKNSRYRTHV
jgi:hypothetical protein